MTDEADFLALMNRFGITPRKGKDESQYTLEDGDYIIKAHDCDVVQGYSCFATIFKFDKEGKFVEMGIWE